ncbi:hypothetical protein QJQ45_013734 [Haematococcus lacustris]|nr:hypothetical protein QJQ45_013734 [Haematococcus lacustris]
MNWWPGHFRAEQPLLPLDWATREYISADGPYAKASFAQLKDVLLRPLVAHTGMSIATATAATAVKVRYIRCELRAVERDHTSHHTLLGRSLHKPAVTTAATAMLPMPPRRSGRVTGQDGQRQMAPAAEAPATDAAADAAAPTVVLVPAPTGVPAPAPATTPAPDDDVDDALLAQLYDDPSTTALQQRGGMSEATKLATESALSSTYAFRQATLRDEKFQSRQGKACRAIVAHVDIIYALLTSTCSICRLHLAVMKKFLGDAILGAPSDRAKHFHDAYYKTPKLLCAVMSIYVPNARNVKSKDKFNARSISLRITNLQRATIFEHSRLNRFTNIPEAERPNLLAKTGVWKELRDLVDGHDKAAYAAGEVQHTTKHAKLTTAEDWERAKPHMDPRNAKGLSDWPFFLSLAEFAVNNSWQESIQSTPFLVNTGQSPLTPALLELPGEVYCPSARKLSEWWQSNVKQARHFMEQAQQRQAYLANKGRREVEFSPGQLVLLSTKNLRLKPGKAKKLLPRFIGPFKVLEHVGPVAVRLDLPPAMARMHPVFHVALLRPYTSEHPHLPPPVDWLDEAPLYEVEKLLAHRGVRAGRARGYLHATHSSPRLFQAGVQQGNQLLKTVSKR